MKKISDYISVFVFIVILTLMGVIGFIDSCKNNIIYEDDIIYDSLDDFTQSYSYCTWRTNFKIIT